MTAAQSTLVEALRSVDRSDTEAQAAKDNELLALAIASVDHVRAQTKASVWTAAHADAIRVIWGALASLPASHGPITPTFAPNRVVAPSQPSVAAARREIEAKVSVGPSDPKGE